MPNFRISMRPIPMKGQCLLTVERPDSGDKHPLVQQQVPEEFARWVMEQADKEAAALSLYRVHYKNRYIYLVWAKDVPDAINEACKAAEALNVAGLKPEDVERVQLVEQKRGVLAI